MPRIQGDSGITAPRLTRYPGGNAAGSKRGFGSGMTCWRRLQEWNRAGVWQRLHELLLAELQAAGKLDWSRAVIDSSHVRAARRGPKADRVRSTAPERARNTTC